MKLYLSRGCAKNYYFIESYEESHRKEKGEFDRNLTSGNFKAIGFCSNAPADPITSNYIQMAAFDLEGTIV
ncbi:MAG TPA: hypothetical protein DCP92_14230 [Nitrospiraceae bacterium]|nr:hypothetical protein [Nitrospiraceae bacterium]